MGNEFEIKDMRIFFVNHSVLQTLKGNKYQFVQNHKKLLQKGKPKTLNKGKNMCEAKSYNSLI